MTPIGQVGGGAWLPSPPHWTEGLRETPILLCPLQNPALRVHSAFNWLFIHVNLRPSVSFFSINPIITFLAARLISDWF